MLSELCKELNNWFDKERYFGKFTITDGTLDVSDIDIQENQYFRIVGSVFNDGVYKYVSSITPTQNAPATHSPVLTDETFSGAVWTMAVPPSVIDLSERISDWETKYGGMVSSPYKSESFGGYSYTKADSGQGYTTNPTWQSSFAGELNRWRKARCHY